MTPSTQAKWQAARCPAAFAGRQPYTLAAAGKEVVMADGASDGQLESRTAGYELAVPGGGTGASGRKVLGSRDFALFYR